MNKWREIIPFHFQFISLSFCGSFARFLSTFSVITITSTLIRSTAVLVFPPTKLLEERPETSQSTLRSKQGGRKSETLEIRHK